MLKTFYHESNIILASLQFSLVVTRFKPWTNLFTLVRFFKENYQNYKNYGQNIKLARSMTD